jgi:hypothetical protein
LITYEEDKEKARTVWYNAIAVKLPARDERFFMVVVRGFGQEPIMLLTKCRIICGSRRISGGSLRSI